MAIAAQQFKHEWERYGVEARHIQVNMAKMTRTTVVIQKTCFAPINMYT